MDEGKLRRNLNGVKNRADVNNVDSRPNNGRNQYGNQSGNAGAPRYVSRGNAKLDEANLPFIITTDQIEAYIQKKMDVVAEEKHLEKINIHVHTIEPGRNFYPLVITLPLSALEDYAGDGDDEEEGDQRFFENKKKDRTTRVIDPYFRVFYPYLYTLKEINSFYTENYRSMFGIDRRSTIDDLKKISSTRFYNANGTNIVICLLDPLKVFKDMLYNPNDKRDFKVYPTRCKRTKTGVFRYTVSRVIVKNNQKRGNWIEDLNKQIRLGR